MKPIRSVCVALVLCSQPSSSSFRTEKKGHRNGTRVAVPDGNSELQVRRMRTDLTSRVSVSVLVVAVAAVAFAVPLAAVTTERVPEISGASLSAGLGLLGAGMLWLRARRKVK